MFASAKIELLQDKSSLTVKHDGSTRTLTLDKDYVMGGDPLSSDTKAEGEVVFVGFGVSAPEFGYDDYAGIDVRGKIVAALYGAPSRLPVRSRRPFFFLGTETAHGRGAWGDWLSSDLGGQGGTAHSVFRVRSFFEGTGAALAG